MRSWYIRSLDRDVLSLQVAMKGQKGQPDGSPLQKVYTASGLLLLDPETSVLQPSSPENGPHIQVGWSLDSVNTRIL